MNDFKQYNIIFACAVLIYSQPALSQQDFQFPQTIKYTISKNGGKTTEQSLFSYTKRGRYVGMINTSFRFIDQNYKNINEIYTYLLSLDYSYVSSIFIQNSKQKMEIKLIQGKGLDGLEKKMLKFYSDKRSGFEPLCKKFDLIDLNSALIMASHSTCMNTNLNDEFYYYSFTDKKIKFAHMRNIGNETMSINGKVKKCNVFQIYPEKDKEIIDIYVYRDSAGYCIPAIITWKNLNISFTLSKIAY